MPLRYKIYGKRGKHWGKQYQHFDTFLCPHLHLENLETLMNSAFQRITKKSNEKKLVPSDPQKASQNCEAFLFYS